MTATERRALLAYADWWFSRSPFARFGATERRGVAIVNHFHDAPGRPGIAQSLAYDNTDGPKSEDDHANE